MQTKYWTETRFNKDDGLPKNAEALVDAAISANPQGVGGPIDILRITREKSSWIMVKPNADSKYPVTAIRPRPVIHQCVIDVCFCGEYS